MFNFALVGCGAMAHWHAQQLQKIPQVKVVALADPAAHHLRQFKDQYFSNAVEFGSFDRLLAHPPDKLDAVVLVTPHNLHYPQAKAALESGIHVLLEKPMVTESKHAYDLWHTVKKTGKLLSITFQAPFTPEYGYLARQRDTGQLGRIQVVSGWLSQGWMQATARTWRQDPAIAGGGQLYDSAAHLFNALIWLVNDPVTEVACFYDKCHSPVDINGAAIVRFRGGAIAALAVGGNCPAFRTEMQIQTDSLLILTDQYGGKLEMTGRDGRPVLPPPEQRWTKGGHDAAGTPHGNFVKAMMGQEPLRVTVRHGVVLSGLMDALYESGANGKVVKVAEVPQSL
jgi:predicted dehydrogenase